jgi:5-(carboxyamino)imidazole ribonucleotide synthase
MHIGIIGAGQLGQMLGYAAQELGHSCFFLDPSENPPAAKAGPVIQAPFDDRVALAVLADKCDVLTYEFENVSRKNSCSSVSIYRCPITWRSTRRRICMKRSARLGCLSY